VVKELSFRSYCYFTFQNYNFIFGNSILDLIHTKQIFRKIIKIKFKKFISHNPLGFCFLFSRKRQIAHSCLKGMGYLTLPTKLLKSSAFCTVGEAFSINMRFFTPVLFFTFYWLLCFCTQSTFL
jgi:hypothetical protein